MAILSNLYQKLTILNLKTGEEIAVITHGDTPVVTADASIAVKLMPADCDSEIIVESPLRHSD